MSLARQVSKPLERLSQNVNSVEVATVGLGVLTIGWLARYVREKKRLKSKTEFDEGIECLEDEEVLPDWKDFELEVFQDTNRCMHPLDRLTSFDLNIPKQDMPFSDKDSLCPVSLKPDDVSSVSDLSVPEWQACSRGLLQKAKANVDLPANNWFSLFSHCCCGSDLTEQFFTLLNFSTTESAQTPSSPSPFSLTNK